MKKSISYWSFPGGLEGEAPLADVFREAKKHGFQAVEPALGDYRRADPDDLQEGVRGHRGRRQGRRHRDVEPCDRPLLGQVAYRQRPRRPRRGPRHRQGASSRRRLGSASTRCSSFPAPWTSSSCPTPKRCRTTWSTTVAQGDAQAREDRREVQGPASAWKTSGTSSSSRRSRCATSSTASTAHTSARTSTSAT